MKRLIFSAILLSTLVACVSAPTGPTIAIMPREGKPFEVFQKEDQECRQFASNGVADTSNAALKEGATSAAVGAALGAAAGLMIGGGSHTNVGMLGGAAVGAMNSAGKQNQAQVQYNIAYQQCMYAKGNQVPSYKPIN